MLDFIKRGKAAQTSNGRGGEVALWHPSLGESRLDQEKLVEELQIGAGAVGLKRTVELVSTASELLFVSETYGETTLISPAMLERAREVIAQNKKDLGYNRVWIEEVAENPAASQQNPAEIGLVRIREHIETLYAEPVVQEAKAA